MTDIIGTVAFAMSFNSLTDPEAEFRKQEREMFKGGLKSYEMLAIFFVPAFRLFVNAKFFSDKGTNFLRNAFWYVINERIKTGIKRTDLIDIFIEIKKAQETEPDDSFSKSYLNYF